MTASLRSFRHIPVPQNEDPSTLKRLECRSRLGPTIPQSNKLGERDTVEPFNRATEIKERFGLSCWDAAILAAAQMLGCEAVYSEDLDYQEDYDGTRVINPFSSVN